MRNPGRVVVIGTGPAQNRRADVTMRGDLAAELFEEPAPGGLSNHWSSIWGGAFAGSATQSHVGAFLAFVSAKHS